MVRNNDGKLLMSGLFNTADQILFSSLEKQPEESADALAAKGFALVQQEKITEALAIYEKVLNIEPEHFDTLQTLGSILVRFKQFDIAIQLLSRAIEINPNHAVPYYNLGIALKEVGRAEEALDSYNNAISIQPDYAEAYFNRGVTLKDLGRLDEELASYDQAIAFRPELVEAHCNRGDTLKALGNVEEAIASYDNAIAIEPSLAEAYWNKSSALLLKGDFERGWQHFEWRWKTPSLPLSKAKRNFEEPLWLGDQSLQDKSILLYSEQGLGDTIQFCRYVSLVARLGAKVILEIQKPLWNLLKDLEGVSQLVARGDPLPAFDYQCPLMSLPLAFKTSLTSIPGATPYLSVDAEHVDYWAKKLGVKTKPRVGLVWSGGFRADQPEVWAVHERRNIALNQIVKLKLPGIDFYSLQKGDPAESDLKALQAELWPESNFYNYTSELQDFTDTAALIKNLDLVISVDTSTAHLAAAMGKPTWLLNRKDTCWRWLLDRSDSPWYPSVKLYRQEEKGNWDDVLWRVRDDLKIYFSV